MRDVPKSGGSLIAEQSDSAFSREGLAYGDQIHPAVVVVVQRRDSPAAHPQRSNQRQTLERFSEDISPDADSRRSPVRERQVHPTIVIEIGRYHSRGWSRHADRPWPRRAKRSLASVHEQRGKFLPAGDYQINPAVVVEIASDGADRGGAASEPQIFRPVHKCSVSIVSPDDVSRSRRVLGECEGLRAIFKREVSEPGDINVEITIAVVVDECHAHRQAVGIPARLAWRAEPGLFRYVLECAVPFVMEERDAVCRTDRQ